MNKLFAGAAAAALIAGLAAAQDNVVNVYNWSDYVVEDTIAKFEAETGIKVNYDVFDSNETLEAKMLTGSSAYDVVVPSTLSPSASRTSSRFGQRQRAALFLLDEPLGALDKKLREETQFELIKIQETLGVTFVVVTHDQEEAMTLATRVGVMRAGKIVQVAEPREVYEYPNSRFVAEFIGSVNMFEGRVVEDAEDHVRIASAEAGCDIHVSHGVSRAPNQRLRFAVRPEKIELHRERPEGDANVAGGMVEEIAYMGTHATFRVKLDSGKLIRVARSNLARHDEGAPRWDDRVFVTWGSAAGVVVPA